MSDIYQSQQHSLDPIQQRRAMRYAYAGQSFGIIMSRTITGAVGLLFILHMGGTDFQAILLPVIFSLVSLLQIPISLMVHPANGKKMMLNCWLISGLLVGIVAACPSFIHKGEASAWILLAVIAIAVAIQQAGNTFWFPLLRGAVPLERSGRFFGTLRATWSFSAFGATMIIGWFLGKEPDSWQFQVVIACSIGLFLCRNLFIRKIPENGQMIANDHDFQNWRHHISDFLTRRDVLIFCLYVTLMLFCSSFLAQPLVLYMKTMGYPTKDNIIINGFVLLGMAFTLILSGHLVDRFGTKRVFFTAHIVLCLTCFSVVIISMQEVSIAKMLLPVSMIVFGATMAASGLATSAQLFHLAPDRGQAFFMSLSRILMMAGACLSPLVVVGMAHLVDDPLACFVDVFSLRLDLFQVIFASAGIMMIVLITVLHFVADVRPRQKTA